MDPLEEPIPAQIASKSKGKGKPNALVLSGALATSSVKKEFSIRTRIRAVTILDDRALVSKITIITGIGKSRVYSLAVTARERGWKENCNMIVETWHVANAPRSGRPQVLIEVIGAVLKVVTKNLTTRGYSTAQISREVKKAGFEVAPRTVWKILKARGYN